MLASLAALMAVAPAALADIATLDFEAYSDSTVLTNQIPGLTFDNALVYTSTGSLFADDFPPNSGVAVVFDFSGPISLVINLPAFGATAVNGVQAYFTYASTVTMEAFGPGNTPLGSVTGSFPANYVSSGNPPNELLQIVAADIRSVKFTGDPGGGSFVMDDLSLDYSPAPNAVPEPQTWLLMATAIAAAVWRRTAKSFGAPRH